MFPPALVLLILAPAIGELLSSSSPPSEFFNPIIFLLLTSLYGSGAIVVRELKIRWKKDYRGMILLGSAYGIVEEGLMAKSFFDPNWMDLGIFGVFGRWLGVNWVWTEVLIIFHAVFSITIPIVLVELAYPDRRDEPWIGERALAGFAILLAATTAFGFFFLTPYLPPLSHTLASILATALVVVVARKLGLEPTGQSSGRAPSARLLWVIGFASTLFFFITFYAGPFLVNNPVAIILLEALIAFAGLRYLSRVDWHGAGSDLRRLAVVAGALSFLIGLAPLQELDKARVDNPSGMTLVALAAIVGLVLLWRKVREREPREVLPPPPPT